MTEPRRLPTSLTGAASRPQRSECDIHVFRVHDEASNERHFAFPALVLQPPPGLWPPSCAVDIIAFHYPTMPNVASRNRSRVHLGVPRRPCPRARARHPRQLNDDQVRLRGRRRRRWPQTACSPSLSNLQGRRPTPVSSGRRSSLLTTTAIGLNGSLTMASETASESSGASRT